MCIKQCFYISYITLLLPSLAIAESKTALTASQSNNTGHSESIVITGTRTAHNFYDAPVKVEVITQAELQQQHAFDLNDGLKTIPGIHEVKVMNSLYISWRGSKLILP